MSELVSARMKALAFAAIREHECKWIGNEDARFQTLNKNGIIDRRAVEKVMSDLSVSRNLPIDQRDDFFALYQKFVDDSWSDRSLAANGITLQKLVNMWKDSGKGRQRLSSLACKVTWYIHPINWTFYDSFARNALRIPDGDQAVAKYYKQLEEVEFVSLCDALRSPLNSYNENLWPERVVDKLLWIVGDSLRGIYTLPEIPSSLSEDMEECIEILSSSKLMHHLRHLSIP